jgi:hypothetical protein
MEDLYCKNHNSSLKKQHSEEVSMSPIRCPGQDMRNWKPDDIFEVLCPFCQESMEFWKDEPVLTCPACNKEVRNPHMDIGCAKWCKYADICMGIIPDDSK